MKHKLEWEETPLPAYNKEIIVFSALSKLHDEGVAFEYRLTKQKGRWVDESESELLEKLGKRQSWSNLSDAKKALQNRENRLLKNL